MGERSEPTGIGAERRLSLRGGTEPAPYTGIESVSNHPGQRRTAERLRRGREGWVGIGAEIIPKVSSNAGQSLSQPAADSSCCGTQNSLFAKRSQNFDHCHSFLLASSATGGARKRPPLHKGAFRTGDADCRVASLLAMTVLILCHSEEAQRADVGIRSFLRWTGVRAAESSAPTGGCREPPQPPGQRSERGKRSWSNSVFAR